MFEQKTYENLLREKLEKIDSVFDKREGSVIYDAMAPNSAEAAQIYLTLDWLFLQMFGDTADREYLIKIARDTRGIEPEPATRAILKGEFNKKVEIGARFNLEDLNYEVLSVIDDTAHTYRVQCETAGTDGNRRLGSMMPIQYIEGMTKAELTEVLIPGEEEESTEHFRKRWKNAFQSQSFAGNKADYKEKIKNMNGVGGVKVIRAQNAEGIKIGGHVKCILIDSEFHVPSDALIQEVQTRIDPLVNAGEGEGLAPIGHEVHIRPIRKRTIDIQMTITYESGYIFEDLQSYFEQAADDYFLELSQAWEETEQLVVRISQLEARVLNITGVVDVKDTTFNGAGENLILAMDEIAVRGSIYG